MILWWPFIKWKLTLLRDRLTKVEIERHALGRAFNIFHSRIAILRFQHLFRKYETFLFLLLLSLGFSGYELQRRISQSSTARMSRLRQLNICQIKWSIQHVIYRTVILPTFLFWYFFLSYLSFLHLFISSDDLVFRQVRGVFWIFNVSSENDSQKNQTATITNWIAGWLAE